MTFKLIKEAQAISALGESTKFIQTVQQILGAESIADIPVLAERDQSIAVTPRHYNQWLKLIIDIANQQNIKLTKYNFEDLAHEVLDNDSFVDSISTGMNNDLKTRQNIVNTLYRSYQASAAHTKLQSHVASVAKQAEEEEHEMTQKLVGSALNKPTNPFPPNTLRHALWANAKRTTKSEDEETFDQYVTRIAPNQQSHTLDDMSDEITPDQLAAQIVGSDQDRIEDLERRVSNIEQQELSEPHTNTES